MKSIKITLFGLILLCGSIQSNAQVNDTTENLVSPFQFSFFYPLGTLGKDAHLYTNQTSINLLAGVSGGLDGVELSGWGSVVLGDIRGAQLAGIFNVGLEGVTGAQIAGTVNSVLGDVTGAQVAGTGNFALGNVQGAQVSGVLNMTMANLEGAQVAGVANFAMQGSDAVQVAGVANVVPGRMNGVQVSGVMNFARQMNGFQVGLVNVADSFENGMPIGFLSFVRKGGYNHLEIGTSDLMVANANLKLGVKKFYNIFGFGIDPTQNRLVSGATYGVGTAMDIRGNFGMNVDLTASTLSDIEKWDEEEGLNMITRLSVSASYQFAGRFTLYGGGAVNFLVQDRDSDILAGEYTYTWNETETTYRMGFGFNAGIRF